MAIRRTLITLDILWDDERLSETGICKQDHPGHWDYRALLDLDVSESVSVARIVNVETMGDSEYHITEPEGEETC